MTKEQFHALLLISQFWRRAMSEGHAQQIRIAEILSQMIDGHLKKERK